MPRIGVSPNGRQWQLTREGEIVSLHSTRDDAVDAARDLIGDEPAEVIVVDDGADVTAVLRHRPDEDPGADRGDRGAPHPEPNEAR